MSLSGLGFANSSSNTYIHINKEVGHLLLLFSDAFKAYAIGVPRTNCLLCKARTFHMPKWVCIDSTMLFWRVRTANIRKLYSLISTQKTCWSYWNTWNGHNNGISKLKLQILVWNLLRSRPHVAQILLGRQSIFRYFCIHQAHNETKLWKTLKKAFSAQSLRAAGWS